MPAMYRPLLVLCGLLCAAACGPSAPISRAIKQQFEQSGRTSVDLARAVPQPWKQVCIIGPYGHNQKLETLTGARWNSPTSYGGVADDGVAVLVFVDEANRVAASVDHPRNAGDFSNLNGQCIPRHEAKFVQVNGPERGWPGLFVQRAGERP